jgi:hypothetical protein
MVLLWWREAGACSSCDSDVQVVAVAVVAVPCHAMLHVWDASSGAATQSVRNAVRLLVGVHFSNAATQFVLCSTQRVVAGG